MYYIKIQKEDVEEGAELEAGGGGNANRLVYYCQKCLHEDENIAGDNVVVSHLQLKKKEQTFAFIINKHTKYDPTLPRETSVPCPNKECGTNRETNPEEREIISIRYDDAGMKYVYLCSTCEYVWEMNKQDL